MGRLFSVCVGLFFMASIGVTVQAQDVTVDYSEIFQEANRAFENGDYAEAAQKFLMVVQWYEHTEDALDSYIAYLYEMAGYALYIIDEDEMAYHALHKSLIHKPTHDEDAYNTHGFGFSNHNALIYAAAAMVILIEAETELNIPDRGITKTENAQFKIAEIISESANEVLVKIQAGLYDGIIPGTSGSVVGVYTEDFEDKGAERLGIARLDEADAQTGIVSIEKTSTEYSILPGDVVRLPYRKPDIEWQTPLFQIYAQNIMFMDKDGTLFLHFRQLLDYGSPHLEQQILYVLLDDIRQTAQQLADVDLSEYAQPLEFGRFAGLNIIEALRQTELKDIIAYLDYVNSFPGNYFGRVLQFNQFYATWVISGTPTGLQVLLNRLAATDNPSEIEKIIKDHESEITGGDFLIHWVTYTTELINNKALDEASILLNRIETVARLLGDAKALAWTQFNFAYLLDTKDEEAAAIREYQKAYTLFLEADELAGASYAINNIAISYNELGQYRLALEAFGQAFELKKKVYEMDPSYENLLSMARSYAGKGYSQYFMGNLPAAMVFFNGALEYIEDLRTTAALYEKARYYNFIGRAFQRQGDETRAIHYHTEEREIYRSLLDEAKEADAIDWLAFATSNSSVANALYMESYEINKRLGLTNDMGFSLSNVAQTYWQLGEFDLAVEYHHKAIGYRQEAENIKGEAYSWGKLGELYAESGRTQEAFDAYERASRLYESIGERMEVATLNRSLGSLYLSIEDFRKAEAVLLKAIEYFLEREAMYEYGLALSDLGDVYYTEKEYQKAEEIFRQSIEIQQQTGDKTGLIYNQIYLGHIYRYFRINADLARKHYEEALRDALEIGNRNSEYTVYNALAGLEVEMGNYPKAIELYEDSITFYNELDDRQTAASRLIDLAFVYVVLGEFEKAEAYNQIALETARSFSNTALMAYALSGLGELNRLRGDYAGFYEIIHQTRAAYIEIDNKYGLANSYISSGNFYNLTNEYEKAIRDYLRSDSIYVELRTPYFRATPMNNIGNVLFMQGNYERALEYFYKAHELNSVMEGISNFAIMIANNIADTYRELKNFEKAGEWINLSMELSNQSGNERRYLAALRSRGNLNLSMQEYETAYADLIEVHKQGHITREVEFQIELAKLAGLSLLRLNRMDEARTFFEEAVNRSNEIGSRRYLWKTLGYLGELEFVEGNFEQALEHYKASIEVIEFTRRRLSGGEDAQQLFLAGEEKLRIYDATVRILMAKGEVEEAMTYALKGNLENIQSQIGLQVAESQEEALRRARDIQLRISGLEQSLANEKSRPEDRRNTRLIEELNNLKTIAETNYLSYVQEIMTRDRNLSRHLETTVNPNQLRANRRRIPQEMVVVQYLVSANHLYIFVATRDSVFAREIPVKKEWVDEKAVALYDMLKFRPSGSTRTIGITNSDEDYSAELHTKMLQLSDELYHVLIEPIIPEIEGRSHVAFIPNGTLNLVPFHALTPLDNDDSQLNQTFSTFYNNDLSVFGMQMYDFEEFRLFAVGNADNSLPFAEKEVKLLADLFPDSEILIREQATKSRLFEMSDEFNILHFATHGVLDFQVAENSFLVLASDEESGDDGRLTISDIYRIRNVENVGLVTLSACETAFNLETMIGWPVNTAIAFLNIGVPSVVATLWQVDDEATSLFMQYFYENVPNMDKATALREARKSLAENEKFSHPYYWAAFTLMGDWR